jgi:hypothetical protein
MPPALRVSGRKRCFALALVVSAGGLACGSSASSQETPPRDDAGSPSCEASNTCGVGLPPVSDEDSMSHVPCGSFNYPCREAGGAPPGGDAGNGDAEGHESSTPDGGADSADGPIDANAAADAGKG